MNRGKQRVTLTEPANAMLNRAAQKFERRLRELAQSYAKSRRSRDEDVEIVVEDVRLSVSYILGPSRISPPKRVVKTLTGILGGALVGAGIGLLTCEAVTLLRVSAALLGVGIGCVVVSAALEIRS